MLFTELIPPLKELSHTDKLLLIHFLAAKLLKESSLVPLDAQNKIASQGLYDSFETAAVLAKTLVEKKRQHMVDKVRFVFTEINPELSALSMLPYLPLIFTSKNRFISVSGLLNTGSSVNVLLYEIGLSLGAV
ncbi:MAG: hypothetical protein V7L29_27415 [Nostoc sp.]|uniref:hypothetical protein n=1 Tax=Nostoc sp. TaxID=1180 RepID=UPI002FFC7A5E